MINMSNRFSEGRGMHIRKIQKVGNSLSIGIPDSIVSSEHFSKGQLMIVQLNDEGFMCRPLDLEQLAMKIKKG